MAEIVHRRGIGCDRHQLGPFAADVSGLFLQLTSGTFERCLPFLHHAGADLHGDHIEGMAVLAFQNEPAVLGLGDDVDPCGNIILLDYQMVT